MFNFRNSDLVLEARKSKFIPKLGVLMLIAFAVYYISSIVSAIPLSVIMGIIMGTKLVLEGDLPIDEATGAPMLDTEAYEKMLVEFLTSRESVLISLFLTVVTIFASIIVCKYIEKRSLYSMGFVKKNCVLSYIFGLFIGLLMFSAVYLICVGTRAVEFKGLNPDLDITFFVLFFLAFVVQGASEEIFLRGFFTISAARNAPTGVAVATSSLLFAMLHFANSGFSFIPFINLFLFGIFASLYMLRGGNIWGISAIHSMWNFSQGNIFGCRVSGMNVGESLFLSSISEIRASTNGGAFGPEGGVAVSLVLVVAIMLVVFIPSKKDSNLNREQKKELYENL